MDNDVLIAFIVFQAVFLFLDLYIYTKTNKNLARKWEYSFFILLIVVHIVYIAFNSLWSLQEYGLLHLSKVVMTIICIGSFLSISTCAFIFFLFTVETFRLTFFNKKIVKALCFIPGVITAVLTLISPWTGLVFSLDSSNTIIQGPAYPIMLISSSLYLLAVVIIASYNLIKAKVSVQRNGSIALLLSFLIIISFVILDDLLKKASILPVAVFAVIIVIFINMQQANINSDALTGMNNRRKALDFVTNELLTVSSESPLFLFICDVDGFKSINDHFGHNEGDEALILCAEVLKETIARYNGFAARLGGDEFLFSIRPAKNSAAPDISLVIEEINSLLKTVTENANKPYELAMSIGYTECTQRAEPLNACIKRADEMLYKQKQIAHASR